MDNALTNKSLVSKSTTNFLKVLFESLVLAHHLYLPSTVIGGEISTVMGICAVAGFLFLSGYGVGMQYQKKGDAYISHLIKKRVVFNYLLIIIVNMCYLTLFIMKGGQFKSFIGALCSLLYLPFSKDYVTLSNWVYFIGDLLLYYVLFVEPEDTLVGNVGINKVELIYQPKDSGNYKTVENIGVSMKVQALDLSKAVVSGVTDGVATGREVKPEVLNDETMKIPSRQENKKENNKVDEDFFKLIDSMYKERIDG